MNEKNYTWVSIYNKIAFKLDEFSTNRKKLLEIMYEILEEIGVFNNEDEYNCNLDKVNGIRCKYDDFDPFSFMNRLAVYNFDNKIKFIQKFEEKTGMPIDLPADFNGVPSVMTKSSCMISFKDERNENDIQDYWNLFEIALLLPNNPRFDEDFVEKYNICINKKGCSFNLSSCLFRMNANYYLSLDSINRDYLEKKFNLKIDNCPDGRMYLELIRIVKKLINDSNEFSSLVDFSHKAWLEAKKQENNSGKVWLYSPGENALYWDECINNGEIYIGWDKLGNLKNYSTEEEIYNAIKSIYNEDNPKMSKCACSDFANVMKPGDIIIAKKGLNKLLGYGIVSSDYEFNEMREIYKNTRKVEWKKIGEWINDTGTGNPIKTLTEISQYKGYPEQLLNIINNGEENNYITRWIIPANPTAFDVDSAFNENGFIDWTQRVGYKVGDIVYIYLSATENKIKYKAVVEKINMNIEDTVDDSKYNIGLDNQVEAKYTRLKFVKKYDDERLIFSKLSAHGLNGNLRSAIRVVKELADYIDFVEYGNNITSENIIYYGGPGCGKSYLVNDLYCKNEALYIRTTFYPDYTNSDFVGQLIPIYDEEREKLLYKVQPGPFTRALEMALDNLSKNVYLIVEEINRGNASAIFGDIFQLLDRNKIGESEYEISNNIIESYLKNKISPGKIKIPRNLSIIATMNSSDQNVYVLDSAFKRRWKMKYISNKFSNDGYDNELGNMEVPKLNIKWNKFIKIINSAIIETTFGINNEDKQIGKYFITKDELVDENIFAEKVLMYLWDDVAKINRIRWFIDDIKTFEDLVDKYLSDGINIFSEDIKTKLVGDLVDLSE